LIAADFGGLLSSGHFQTDPAVPKDWRKLARPETRASVKTMDLISGNLQIADIRTGITSISPTDAARHLGDYLARVKHKGEHFLLTRFLPEPKPEGE
jgi:hypothetical protein